MPLPDDLTEDEQGEAFALFEEIRRELDELGADTDGAHAGANEWIARAFDLGARYARRAGGK